ncbi:MAG: hypothetical protein KTR13_08030, partial [Saprospiraceae bacterium]|nr:hypothetical protein [Saprospiraceae bacterium]
MIKQLVLAVLLIGFAFTGSAQNDYPTNSEVNQRIEALGTSSLVTIKLVATTASNQPIKAVEIGKDKNNPALVVVGNVDGSHILGVELALQFAERLVNDQSVDSINQLLGNTTFIVIPNVSPDAYAQAFNSLKYERIDNSRKMDNDRDGDFDEDGYDDLNGDGLITMMRIKHPTGTYRSHEADPRVLVEADVSKGEEGIYLVMEEGLDNDQDGHYNEDGPGGVAFNHNLTYKYPNFTSFAGHHPVSEPETKGLLDYLYDKWNVFAVMSFGTANNLSSPTNYNQGAASKRVVASWLEKDVALNKVVAAMYKEHLETEGAPESAAPSGDFHSWAYFHYGRFSFSSPAWWPTKFELPKDSLEAAKFLPNKDNNQSVDLLRTAAQQGRTIFTEWTSIQHPDYPGYEVEVGGFHPYAHTLPPFQEVDSMAIKHNDFLLQLASGRSILSVNDVKTE